MSKEKYLREELAKKRAQQQEEEIKKMMLAQQEEEDAKKQQQIAAEAEEPEKEEKRIDASPATKRTKDWSDIVADFENNEGGKRNANGVLLFKNQEEITRFFTEQAKKGREFLCGEVNAQGEPLDHYEFSCGSGKLYEGSLNDIKNQLTQDLATASQENQEKIKRGMSIIDKLLPKSEPTSTSKKRLQEMKEASTPQTSNPDSETEQSLSPTPKLR